LGRGLLSVAQIITSLFYPAQQHPRLMFIKFIGLQDFIGFYLYNRYDRKTCAWFSGLIKNDI
jgi:hypothetical protein